MTTEIAIDPIYALACASGEVQTAAYFAARESGLYRSDDAGQSWRPLFADLNLEAPLATTAVLTVGDSTGLSLFAGVPGGILQSSNQGTSWQATMLPAAPTVSALAASPCYSTDGTLFAATLGDGVLLSVDRGRNWSHWNFGLLDQQVLCLAVSPSFGRDATLYAGTETGLFRSTNGGRSWREIALPCDAPVISVALPPAYAPDAPLLVGTDGAGLWRSDPHGETWSSCAGLPADSTVLSVAMRQTPQGQLRAYAVTSDTVALSHDGGTSWSAVAQFEDPDDQITAACEAWEGRTLALGHANGCTTVIAIAML